jgi:hypothetical protein
MCALFAIALHGMWRVVVAVVSNILSRAPNAAAEFGPLPSPMHILWRGGIPRGFENTVLTRRYRHLSSLDSRVRRLLDVACALRWGFYLSLIAFALVLFDDAFMRRVV